MGRSIAKQSEQQSNEAEGVAPAAEQARKNKVVDEPPPPSAGDDFLSTTDIPPEIMCDADAASVESLSRKRAWDRPYVAPPILERGTILAAGLFMFALAMIWPPLILLFAYIASKLIPYSFRENDDATVRRELYTQFCQEHDDLPDRFINVREYVNFEESYWTNERYVIEKEIISLAREGLAITRSLAYPISHPTHIYTTTAECSSPLSS